MLWIVWFWNQILRGAQSPSIISSKKKKKRFITTFQNIAYIINVLFFNVEVEFQPMVFASILSFIIRLRDQLVFGVSRDRNLRSLIWQQEILPVELIVTHIINTYYLTVCLPPMKVCYIYVWARKKLYKY